MWIINGTDVINRQRDFTDGNGQRQRGVILVQWSKEALAEIGVKPFREIAYDGKWYNSTGFSDEEVDGEIVRTHTTEARYTLEEAKEERIKEINAAAYILLQTTDYYVIRKSDVGTDIPQDIIDERAQVRTDITTNEDAINELDDYSDVIDYVITWTNEEA